ncbi:hypothetical protein GCM10027187_60200 [Streptosporangium sandarakinum]
MGGGKVSRQGDPKIMKMAGRGPREGLRPVKPGGVTSSLQETAGVGGTTAEEQQHAARRRAVRLFRPARSPAGVVVALMTSTALSAAAGVTVGMVTDHPLGRVPYRRIAVGPGAAAWSDPAVILVSLGAIVAGAALLTLALLPGRTRLVPLETSDPRLYIGLTRSALRRTLRAAAESVDEVTGARVRLGARDIEITVISGAERTGPLLRQVGTVVGDRLAGLGAISEGEIVVRLRRRRL